jgi:hypothetical protein
MYTTSLRAFSGWQVEFRPTAVRKGIVGMAQRQQFVYFIALCCKVVAELDDFGVEVSQNPDLTSENGSDDIVARLLQKRITSHFREVE